MMLQQFLKSFFMSFQEYIDPILYKKYGISFKSKQKNIDFLWDKYPNTFLLWGVNSVKKNTPWTKSYKDFEGNNITISTQFNEYEVQLDFYSHVLYPQIKTLKMIERENISLLVLQEIRGYFDYFCSYGLNHLDTKNISFFYLNDMDIFLHEKLDSSQVFERLNRKLTFRINEELILSNEGEGIDFIKIKVEEKK